MPTASSAKTSSCIRGERLVFAGLDFALRGRRRAGARRPQRQRQVEPAAPHGRAVAPGRRARSPGTGRLPRDEPACAPRAGCAIVGHLDAVKPALTVAREPELLGRPAGARGAAAERRARRTSGSRRSPTCRCALLSAGQRRRAGAGAAARRARRRCGCSTSRRVALDREPIARARARPRRASRRGRHGWWSPPMPASLPGGRARSPLDDFAGRRARRAAA